MLAAAGARPGQQSAAGTAEGIRPVLGSLLGLLRQLTPHLRHDAACTPLWGRLADLLRQAAAAGGCAAELIRAELARSGLVQRLRQV